MRTEILNWLIFTTCSKTDTDTYVTEQVVRDRQTGKILFVPAAVTPSKNNATPFTHMTQDTVASYSNFRYYSGAWA
jgi:hypothetical protein